jgi:hypothetical protein
MNIWTVLTQEEADALMDYHADKIGHCDDAEAERAVARIEQLRALMAPERMYDIEDIAA